MRTVALALGALLLASVAVPAAAQDAPAGTPYPDVAFTELLMDAPEDAPFGVADLIALAVGEPGNGTLVFRIEVADRSDVTGVPLVCVADTACTGSSRVEVWFTTPGGEYAYSVSEDGSFGFDACAFDGNLAYCSVTYEAVKVAVGETLTAPYMLSRVSGTAQDYAPGTTYVEEVAEGPMAVGADYTVTGSTSTAATGRISITSVSPDAEVEEGGAATFGLIVRNLGPATTFTMGQAGLPSDWATSFEPQTGSLAVNGTATVAMTVDVPSDAEHGTEMFFQAKAVASSGFNATVILAIRVVEHEDDDGHGDGDGDGDGDGNTTTTSTSGTGGPIPTGDPLDRKDTPGFGLVPAAIALAALALVVRRRLR